MKSKIGLSPVLPLLQVYRFPVKTNPEPCKFHSPRAPGVCTDAERADRFARNLSFYCVHEAWDDRGKNQHASQEENEDAS